MSHQPERKEKNCLNCGATVIGRYCHVCGQENVETRESFWSLGKHFVFDILHFDGKFWHTLKYLIIKPGFVARQYCEGKRNSYLHPIRMYLFTSALFFLLFFALKGNELKISGESALSSEDRIELTNDLNRRLQNKPGDTSILRQLSLLNDASRVVYPSQIDSSNRFSFYMANSRKYNSVEQYDSLQKGLAKSERDNWIIRALTKRGIELKQEYGKDMRQGFNVILSEFLHKVPYILFVSLPLFALLLKLLYVRRKNFYYSDHAVFTLYHYISSFILLILMIAVSQLQNRTELSGLDWVILLLAFVWMIYLLIEMKNFYRQTWSKTLIKFLLLDLLGFFGMVILFIVFLVLSFLL